MSKDHPVNSGATMGDAASADDARETPQLYAVSRRDSRWRFTRRGFVAGAAAVAASGGAAAIPLLRARASDDGAPGAAQGVVRITWRLTNGTGAAWPRGTELRLPASLFSEAAAPIPVPAAQPGETVSVRVDIVGVDQQLPPSLTAELVAPSAAGVKVLLPLILNGDPPSTPCAIVACPTFNPCGTHFCKAVCACVGDVVCKAHCACVSDFCSTVCACVGDAVICPTHCACVADTIICPTHCACVADAIICPTHCACVADAIICPAHAICPTYSICPCVVDLPGCPIVVA